MKESGRVLRIADDLRERLAVIIRGEMRDPRIGLVSVNDVRVSRDLSYADVFVSCLGADDAQARQDFIEVLNRAAGFLRSACARDNHMRTTPKLRFHYDELVGEAARIDSLIQRAVAADVDAQRRRGETD